MQIQYTGHNMEVTSALRDHFEKKFTRVKTYTGKITSVHVTFEVNKLRQIAEANVAVPGQTLHASAESEDMYKTIDLLMDKVSTQLSKLKDKETDHS